MNPANSQFDLSQLVLWADTTAYVLNGWGWTVMIVSISSVLLLVSYCLIKVLNLPQVDQEEVKGPLRIDTGDTQDAD